MSDAFLDWTRPQPGQHPRVLLGNPLTRDLINSRASSTHQDEWQQLVSYVNARLDAEQYPNKYYKGKDAEYAAALAYVYALNTASDYCAKYADRAIEIANYLTTVNQGGSADRHNLRAMGLIYTWCYDRIPAGNRTTLRGAIRTIVKRYHQLDPKELIWGHSHGNITAALLGLTCIIGDDPDEDIEEENRQWMNSILNALDDGTNVSYFGQWRYFNKNGDGATYKGCGAYGYDTYNESYYYWVFPALETLQVDAWSTEKWWFDHCYWKWWHLRGDHTFHRQGDSNNFCHYAVPTSVHMLQILGKSDNPEHKVIARLLYDEMTFVNDYRLWGPFHLWSLIFDPKEEDLPGIDISRGKWLKIFDTVGKVCIRDGHSWEGLNMTISFPPYFLGGHQRRDAGHFEVCYRGVPIIPSLASYNQNETTTYKVPNDPNKPGHRFTYAQRIAGHNVLRIYSKREEAENRLDSFQRQSSPIHTYGVLDVASNQVRIVNDGGQLCPKSEQFGYQPGNLEELFAEPKWKKVGIVHAEETDQYVHVVGNLTDQYWDGKCLYYDRGFLILKPGVIPDWPHPIMLVWDNVVISADGDVEDVIVQVQSASRITPIANSDRRWTNERGDASYDLLSLGSCDEGKIVKQTVEDGGFEIREGRVVDERFVASPDKWDDDFYDGQAVPNRLDIIRWLSASNVDRGLDFFNWFQFKPKEERRANQIFRLADEGSNRRFMIGAGETKITVHLKTYEVQIGDTPVPPEPPVEPKIMKTEGVICKDWVISSSQDSVVAGEVDCSECDSVEITIRYKPQHPLYRGYVILQQVWADGYVSELDCAKIGTFDTLRYQYFHPKRIRIVVYSLRLEDDPDIVYGKLDARYVQVYKP